MKQKKKYPVCTACKLGKDKGEMRQAIALMEAYERKCYGKHYNAIGIDPFANFIGNHFEWACDHCLDGGRAIPANPFAQSTSAYPHFAYTDSLDTCRTCGVAFTFSMQEKKLWYESIQLPVDAHPVHCTQCRRSIRKLKSENKKVSELLQHGEASLAGTDLQTLIDIYAGWGKEDKVKYYSARLRKR